LRNPSRRRITVENNDHSSRAGKNDDEQHNAAANAGWLVTAAKMFAAFPGHLLGRANDEIFKIFYEYVQKGTFQEYTGPVRAIHTLQQFKVL
jgi:hypothetical protein